MIEKNSGEDFPFPRAVPDELRERIRAGRNYALTLSGVNLSAGFFLLADLFTGPGRPALLILCENTEEAVEIQEALNFFTGRADARILLPWEYLPDGDEPPDREAFFARFSILHGLATGEIDVVIIPVLSALQPVPPPGAALSEIRKIARGSEVDIGELQSWLARIGLKNVPLAVEPGEFARRGGIVDIFPMNLPQPVRLDFFGDEIESVSLFDPESQRSVRELDEVGIGAADARRFVRPDAKNRAFVTDHMPGDFVTVAYEPSKIAVRAERIGEFFEDPDYLHPYAAVLDKIRAHPSIDLEFVAANDAPDVFSFDVETTREFPRDTVSIRTKLDHIVSRAKDVYVVSASAAEEERFRDLFGVIPGAEMLVGGLGAGFVMPGAGLAFVTEREIFNRYHVRRKKRTVKSSPIQSFFDLRPDDIVVHENHGIARYAGIRNLRRSGVKMEYLELEFAEHAKIFVPISQINLVQKYVGGGRGAGPELSRIGTGGWEEKKARVKKSLRLMAAELLRVQAERKKRRGIAFAPDDKMQAEFEGAFPYDETPDQIEAISATKNDMEAPTPMDRLICGDVGFGKTECAIRAAFKAALSGYQCAVLVPTTVLAEQHFKNFRERMADFPVHIETLSRFVSQKKQKAVVAAVERGTVDILIGTHRLLSGDIKFRNLGLIVIDEEQRFGVRAKEHLKKFRATVDVLTLTATPIPRTLHMSLLGIKDISSLMTPPPDRLAVKTVVEQWSDEKIRDGVRRELARDGQVFFVHNRVQSIGMIYDRLKKIVPEATIGIGHGQMDERELEAVMNRFIKGQLDVLLSTTIVESGLDIPNANTMFIDRADRYGLADLHQLRGRIGRYRHQAYCHLLLSPGTPLSSVAAERLRAIREYSELGSGFNIAMRDLEIRGAGNILGPQQSGYINSVGYNMYCQLLELAVKHESVPEFVETARSEIDLKVDAFIPEDFIANEKLRIDAYRKIDAAQSLDLLDDVADEIADRFGKLPETGTRLMELARLRILATDAQVIGMHWLGETTEIVFAEMSALEPIFKPISGMLRVIDQNTVHVVMPGGAKKDPLLALKFLLKIFARKI